MKIKKLLAGLTAITAIMGSLVACGTEEADSNSSSETSIKVEEETVAEGSTEETTANEETTAEDTTGEGEEATTSEGETSGNSEETSNVDGEEMTEEKAIELCKEAIPAYVEMETGNISDKTIDEFFRTNNAELAYWYSTGENLTEEEIRTALIEEQKLTEGEGTMESLEIDPTFDMESIEWEKAEELSEEQVQKWEDCLVEMVNHNASEPKDDFDFGKIESVWGVYANEKTEDSTEETTEAEVEIEGMFDPVNPIFLVTKYNGEWKVDLMSSLSVQMYQAFENSLGMDEEESSEICGTEEETTAESASEAEEETTETETAE